VSKKVHIFLSVAIALFGLLQFCDTPNSKALEQPLKKTLSFILTIPILQNLLA